MKVFYSELVTAVTQSVAINYATEYWAHHMHLWQTGKIDFEILVSPWLVQGQPVM